MKANTRTHKGELGTVANQRALNDDLLCRSGDGFAKAAMRATKENPLTAPLHDMARYNDGQAAARGTGNFQNENSPTGLAVAKAHPVATKSPNAWGIYDMRGNVAEWVQDFYDADYYSNSPAPDPKGPANGDGRVARAGPFVFIPG